MGNSTKVHTIDDVRVWSEQASSIHIKAVTGTGDPVELTTHQARDLVAVLNCLIQDIEQVRPHEVDS